MKNEYLFVSHENYDAARKYSTEEINSKSFKIKDSQLWIISFTARNNKEKSAIHLADLHEYIVNYSHHTLSCESSEYFTKKLFALINSMERKLRKVLYLLVCITEDAELKEFVETIENDDLGKIFSSLFIDREFVINVKKEVNANKDSKYEGIGYYSKAEICSHINSMFEYPLWDRILGNSRVSTLRNNFDIVRKYRNDVMHAQNIGRDIYLKARLLFSKVNKELDDEAARIARNIEEVKKDTRNNSKEISSALKAEREFRAATAEMNNTISLIGKEIATIFETNRAGIHLAELLKSSGFEQILEAQREIHNNPIHFAELSNTTKQFCASMQKINDDPSTTIKRVVDEANNHEGIDEGIGVTESNP